MQRPHNNLSPWIQIVQVGYFSLISEMEHTSESCGCTQKFELYIELCIIEGGGHFAHKMKEHNYASIQVFVNRYLRRKMRIRWPSIKKSFWGWRHWRKLTLRTPVDDMVRQSLDWNPQKSLRRGQSRRTWWRFEVEEAIVLCRKSWTVESFRFCIKQVHLNKYHQGVVWDLGPEVRGEDLSLRRLELWFAKDEDETLQRKIVSFTLFLFKMNEKL